MRIVKLQAENFKRLRAVEITPTGDVVKISGRNAQGKSSVLDAIQSALGGVDTAAVPRPIRDGEESAVVVLELDDLIVTRTWSTTGPSKLVVKSRDGVPVTKAQATLNGLLGTLSFDPLEFAGMGAKKQVATLLELVDLPFEPDELAASREKLYSERTDVNRDVKHVAEQIRAIPQPDPSTPIIEVSISDLLEQKHQAEQERHGMSRAADEVTKWSEQVEDLRARLVGAEKEMEAAQHHLAGFDPDRFIDLDHVNHQLSTVESTNTLIRQRQSRVRLVERHTRLTAESDRRTREIAALDQIKTDGLAAAAMPIEGLSFDEDGVTYQGIPFKQASSAEQLRVSVAMAMALNPGLKVIRISDGSLLDSTSLALIEEMASERDYQVWIEMVDESGAVGFVIEDGAVSNV